MATGSKVKKVDAKTQMRGKRRPRGEVVADGTRDKRFPDSLKLVVIAMHEFWLQEIEAVEKTGRSMGCDEFLDQSDFLKQYQQVKDMYKGIAHYKFKGPSAGKKQFKAIVGGKTDMEFYKIRAIAKYIGFNSAGILLLFSQLVGEERRAKRDQHDPKLAAVQLLDALQRIVDATKCYVERQNPGDGLFMRSYDNTDKGYLPDVSVLKLWRDAYRDGPTPVDPSAMLIGD